MARRKLMGLGAGVKATIGKRAQPVAGVAEGCLTLPFSACGDSTDPVGESDRCG
jgi:hypothetical protein